MTLLASPNTLVPLLDLEISLLALTIILIARLTLVAQITGVIFVHLIRPLVTLISTEHRFVISDT